MLKLNIQVKNMKWFLIKMSWHSLKTVAGLATLHRHEKNSDIEEYLENEIYIQKYWRTINFTIFVGLYTVLET